MTPQGPGKGPKRNHAVSPASVSPISLCECVDMEHARAQYGFVCCRLHGVLCRVPALKLGFLWTRRMVRVVRRRWVGVSGRAVLKGSGWECLMRLLNLG